MYHFVDVDIINFTINLVKKGQFDHRRRTHGNSNTEIHMTVEIKLAHGSSN